MAWQFYTKDGELKTAGSGGASQIDELAEISAAARGDIIIRDDTDWDNVNIDTNEVVARAAGDVTGLAIPAQSLLARQAGNLASLTVDVDKLVGRLAGGNLDGLTPSQVKGLLFSGARVYNSASISIPDTTFTTVTFNSESFDTDDYHSTESNTSRLTAPADGYYLVVALGRMVGGSYDMIQQIVKNGTTIVGALRINQSSAGHYLGVSAIVQLSEDDYLEMEVYQDSGGALDLSHSTDYSPIFSIVRLG
jgi:hypothetical protein